mgnify:CR=1 FL=1
MSMISIHHRGDFLKTERFLQHANRALKHFNFNEYGEAGVAALASLTPVDTGKTASSWSYEVIQSK